MKLVGLRNKFISIALISLSCNVLSHPERDTTPYLDGEVRFGALLNTGNTDNKNIDGGLTLTYDKFPWRTVAAVAAQWAQSDNQTKAKRVDLHYEIQKFRTKRQFYFAFYDGLWNPFATYDLTQIFATGFGAKLYKSEDALLQIQVGPGMRINRISGTQERRDEGMVYVEGVYTYQFNDATSFKQNVNMGIGEFNTRSQTITTVRTKMIHNVSLEVSYNTLRNSKIPLESKNKKRLDTSTKINIVYEFT